ncbi:Heat shock protein beta-11 [Borealophlyctis nickersoniae]|nr:Heat shock protein beta-11 [Borealophlyctis nickersoniae]
MPAQLENLALASAGSKIAMATSWHPKHTPDMMIDGNPKTFWVTTGLFPQEAVLTFPAPVSIRKITVSSMKVAHLDIQRSVHEKPVQFEHFVEQDLDDADQGIQLATLIPSAATPAQHLRLTISRGHGPFASIHRIVVLGDMAAKKTEETKQTVADPMPVVAPAASTPSPLAIPVVAQPSGQEKEDGGMGAGASDEEDINR